MNLINCAISKNACCLYIVNRYFIRIQEPMYAVFNTYCIFSLIMKQISYLNTLQLFTAAQQTLFIVDI